MAEDRKFVKEVTDMEEDFPKWYTDVVVKTELVDYGPVKGTMVIRPYGYAIWENIRAELDRRFRQCGVKNAYFPMLIPESYLKREAEHVEGFAPEVAMVTHAGGEKLQENLVIRPTSETIICEMFSKWMQSYRDLPMRVNQWCNVVRWEKTTRPFLRTSEFLWQEGHTVYPDEEGALGDAMRMLGVYKSFAEEVLAIPVFTGRKSEKEKFAGAEATFGMEAMMLDGKSLQAGTSHYLGTNFARAFDMKFLDKDGTLKYGYSSSWGVSTRLIGALIMAHGDNSGLVLPPLVAPVQAIIIPIAAHKGGVTEKAEELRASLEAAGVRAETDNRDASAGWKFNEWEMKGVPLRIEVGPRDIENGKMTVVRRDTREKLTVDFGNVSAVSDLLSAIQKDMLEKSRKLRDSKVRWAETLGEIVAAVDGGFALAPWCGCRECEDKVKEAAAATSRVMTEDPVEGKKCAICEKPAKTAVYFAKAY